MNAANTAVNLRALGAHVTFLGILGRDAAGDTLRHLLRERDIDDLISFLASLTSPQYKEAAAVELERQRELSRTTRPQRDAARAFGPKPVRPKPPIVGP